MSLTNVFKIKQIYNRDLPNTYFNGNFIDFEKQYPYGIAIKNMDPIISRSEYLKPVLGNSSVKLISFVADAYSDMIQEIQTSYAAGKWEKSSVIPNAVAATGAQESLDIYHDYVSGFFKTLTTHTPELAGFYKNKDITSFESFLVFFENRIKGNNVTFKTLNGFLVDQRNIFQSGLAVELFDFSKNDTMTIFRFIVDPGFKRYLVVAKKYGFLVNRNAPWMLVANLNSPAMLKYAAGTAVKKLDAQGVIDRYLLTTTTLSFEFFSKYLISFYNAIADSEPKYQFLKPSKKPGCDGWERVTIERTPISPALIGDTIDEYRIRLVLLYFYFRLQECGVTMEAYSGMKSKFIKALLADKDQSMNITLKRLEHILFKAKPRMKSPYLKKGESPVVFDFAFEAQEAADKLGCKGIRKLGSSWTPCEKIEEYASLTKPPSEE